MALSLQCQKCDETFTVDVADLAAEPELRCPGCRTRAPDEQVEALASALEETYAAISGLRRRFAITFEADSEDLPPPYDEGGRAARATAVEDDDEDEDDDEAEDDED